MPITDAATAEVVSMTGGGFPTHAHDSHQLVISTGGVLVMGIEDQTWVIPRSRGLWIPAGVAHSMGALGRASMTAIWCSATRSPWTWAEPTPFVLTNLIRALIEHLATGQVGDADRTHAKALIFDLLERAPMPSPVIIDVPIPADDRARLVAEGLTIDPADPRTLQQWGRDIGASERTLLRLFQVQTGLGFHEWRTRTRIVAALPLLADGLTVDVVARKVGYASAASFGAAVRRITGASPAALARPR